MINIDKIIQIESSGRPGVVSKKGAVGFMQITPIVLTEWNRKFPKNPRNELDLYDSVKNKIIGTWYLNERIPEFLRDLDIPDCELTRIIAYNWGIGNLKLWFRDIPIETRSYLKKYYELEVL